MSPSGNTFLGRNWDPLPDSEFTIFNLVIRLSKVEQLGRFFTFHPALSFVVGWTTGRNTGLRLLSLFTRSFAAGWTFGRSTRLPFPFVSRGNSPFSTLIERLTSVWHCNMTRFRLQDMPFQVWSLSCGWSGEVKWCTNSRGDYFNRPRSWSEFSAIEPDQGILHWIVDASI